MQNVVNNTVMKCLRTALSNERLLAGVSTNQKSYLVTRFELWTPMAQIFFSWASRWGVESDSLLREVDDEEPCRGVMDVQTPVCGDRWVGIPKAGSPKVSITVCSNVWTYHLK